MTPDVSTFANLFNPSATFTDTRTWTDTDLAGRALPTNGDNIAQDNEIGPSNNPNFGKITNRTLDSSLAREYNLQYGVGIQHELMTGVAVNFNWFRRALFNTAFTRNRAVDPINDWTTTSVISPLTGESITVFQINQNKNGIAPDLYLSNATDTNLRSNTYTGFEVGINARLPRRVLVFGGWGMERTVDTDCMMNTASASATLNSPNTLRFCDQSGELYQNLGASATMPYQHGFKFNGNFPLWNGFEVSASLQSYPGAIKATAGGVSWTLNRGTTRYPTDCAVPGCTPGGVVLASRFAGDPAVTVQLASPGTRYQPRWNQLDFGVRRTFRFRRGVTVQGQVDLFNALNANPVLTEGTGAQHHGCAVSVVGSERRRDADDDPAAAHHPARGAVPVLIVVDLGSRGEPRGSPRGADAWVRPSEISAGVSAAPRASASTARVSVRLRPACLPR
jgi:hypothetical protein